MSSASILLVATLFLTSCRPAQRPVITYQVPPEKREVANKLYLEVLKNTNDYSYVGRMTAEVVMIKVYGEPVRVDSPQ